MAASITSTSDTAEVDALECNATTLAEIEEAITSPEAKNLSGNRPVDDVTEVQQPQGSGKSEVSQSRSRSVTGLGSTSVAASLGLGSALSKLANLDMVSGSARLAKEGKTAVQAAAGVQVIAARGAQEGLSAAEIAAKIDAVKRRMQAEAKPDEAESVAAFIRSL